MCTSSFKLHVQRALTGIFFTMYSHTASTLYLSCAEIGTTGAPSATVPWMKAWIASCWLVATLSLQRRQRALLTSTSVLHWY